jgi:hypothetical protein
MAEKFTQPMSPERKLAVEIFRLLSPTCLIDQFDQDNVLRAILQMTTYLVRHAKWEGEQDSEPITVTKGKYAEDLWRSGARQTMQTHEEKLRVAHQAGFIAAETFRDSSDPAYWEEIALTRRGIKK